MLRRAGDTLGPRRSPDAWRIIESMHHLISATTVAAAAAYFRDGHGLGPCRACLIRCSTTGTAPIASRSSRDNKFPRRSFTCAQVFTISLIWLVNGDKRWIEPSTRPISGHGWVRRFEKRPTLEAQMWPHVTQVKPPAVAAVPPTSHRDLFMCSSVTRSDQNVAPRRMPRWTVLRWWLEFLRINEPVA